MVRILKVKGLEDRKKFLLAESEMYRHTMRLEMANIKYSVALYRSKFTFLKSAYKFLSMMGPIGGFLAARQADKKSGGMLSRIVGAVKLIGKVRPFLKNLAAGRRDE